MPEENEHSVRMPESVKARSLARERQVEAAAEGTGPLPMIRTVNIHIPEKGPLKGRATRQAAPKPTKTRSQETPMATDTAPAKTLVDPPAGDAAANSSVAANAAAQAAAAAASKAAQDQAVAANKTAADAAAAATTTADANKDAAAAAQRPEWIESKFWNGNVDESAKKQHAAYRELETKFHPTAPLSDDQIAPMLQQYAKEKTLTADQYAVLSKHGIEPARAHRMLDGQLRLVADREDKIYAAAGGREKYEELITWGRTGLEEAAKKSHHEQLMNGDTDTAVAAVKSIQALREKALGPQGRLAAAGLGGQAGLAPNDSDVYTKSVDIVNDKMGRKYQSGDPAEVKRVSDKVARSVRAKSIVG